MLGPDARRLWDQAANGRGPFSRLALDAPFQYAGKMWPERVEVQKIPREEDLDPSRVYAFRKIVQELLIPAGVVDMAALASRGGGPRFLHAMWTLYEHC